MTNIFAAAGLAEAAWLMDACLILFALGVVGVVTLFALALRSQRLAVVAAVVLLFATLFFRLWYCFSPFEEAAYADPDVQSAAGMFRRVGVVWVVTCVAVFGSLLFVFLTPKKAPPVAATLPEGAEGAD
jgi:hypothetical protein